MANAEQFQSSRMGDSSADGEVRSLRDEAYDAIKYRIVTCVYKPAQYLNEAQLAQELGIGRTPIHQALQRLMMEGLVDVLPRKGVLVKPVSFDEIREIIDVRLLAEAHCARLAASRVDSASIERLRDILIRSEQGVAQGDIEQLMFLDSEFHSALAALSGNSVLADVLVNLHDRSLRFWFLSLTSPGHHQSVLKEHHDIFNAIVARDPDGAEEATRAHIESFRRNIQQWR